MEVKIITIILAMAFSISFLSFNSVEAINLIEKACFGSQFRTDCTNSIPNKLGTKANDADYKAILLAGLQVLSERAEEGIKEVEKLKTQSQGDDAAKLGTVLDNYNKILKGSKNSIEALDGEDYGTLEHELDAAVKVTSDCEELVPKTSPTQEFTFRMHMAAKNNLGFGNHVGSA